MANFTTLYNKYEKTNDVCGFCEQFAENNVATRFLLVRSLDKNNLRDIIKSYSAESPDGNIRVLTEKAYNSSATIEQLIAYIESKRQELINQRTQELDGLQDVLSEFPVVNCGIRNDKVDDIVKGFVRNKALKTMEALEYELDNIMLPKIRQYSMWSYYNQTANDIIELFFLQHPAVLPTLRKIHDIDFFIKIDKKIIPFDLKFTHISDSYFDLASQGILRSDNSIFDDFYINSNSETNELKKLKTYYQTFKREHRTFDLPGISRQDKVSLMRNLTATGDPGAANFIEEFTARHANYVPTTHDGLYSLEWWNYKYQGERLFCNNNRFFVFLAYLNRFVDGRELKGRTAAIGEKINSLLDNLSATDFHSVHYHYDKQADLVGDYTALSLSTIYYE